MNYSSMINQSKIKNSKVSFEASQIQGKNNIDNSQNTSGLGTKFSYTDPLSQAYLNKAKKKPEIDKASFYSNKYAVPIVQTDVTQIIESQIKEDSQTVSQIKLNATQNTNSLRKQEKLQNNLRLQQKLEFSRQRFLQEAQENLSFNKLQDISITPAYQYSESLINQMNQARENMMNAEFKHSNLLEENISLKKQIQLLKDGIELQNIRFKYYIQSAYNMLRGNSIFILDERLFYILLKSLLTDLEAQKVNFNQKLVATLDAVNQKVTQSSKSLQSLIVDNETVLKFLDHDLNLEHFNTHLAAETLEQLEKQEEGKQEAIIKALHSVISEKVMEIEKYRIADNNNRQIISLLTAKSEEYERHIQRMMISAETEPLKNNLKRIIELKKDNDLLVGENESLKKIIEQYDDSNKNLINENDYLQEKCIIYSKKILQLLLDTNMNEEAIKNQMDQILQQENLDFYLKKRNMEFIKEKYSENSEVQKKNAVQGQEIESLQQQIELANKTIEQMEKKLIDQTQTKGSIPGIINLDDTNQLQHTIQQLSLILLSKDNAVKVDQTTQRIIKQMFSENFDQMVEFQQETIDNLKIKLNEVEQKYFQSESRRIDYLNISFYLSNILVSILDSQKESQIKGKLQKERNQIINFYGKCVQDFQDLIKLQNPKNINPINQWYVNKLKDNQEQSMRDSQNLEKLKSADENILSDLTILQQMGVKPLQEYINMRIGRVEEENEKLKENLKNIKKENVTVAELKKQRLLDEERYERLSKKLKSFCQDNIFTASENNDLIGHYNEDFLLTMFIQANTIEEMISKTLENDEEDVHSRPSVTNDNNQIQKYDSQRDSDPRSNLPPVLNHSIIEEKPGEEDEFIENGKRVKVRKSFRNLSSSGHSQQEANHQREGSGQGFDQKIQINISISSPDRSFSSSFSGQAPAIENQSQKMQQIEDNYPKKQQNQQQAISQKQYEEDMSYNKQYTNSIGQYGQDSDSVTSRSSVNTIQQNQQTQVPSKPTKSFFEYQQQQLIMQNQQQQLFKNVEQQQIQQQRQLDQQYNNQQEQQTFISNSQTPSFKNTPKSTNNNSLSNIQQLSITQLQQNFSNVRQNLENEEYIPRVQKPTQYVQQLSNQIQSNEEKQRSNKSSKQSSIHQSQEMNEISKQNINQQIINEKLNNQQQQMRQKEIQDLKRFSAQSTIQQFIDPQFKKRSSEPQIIQGYFNKEEAMNNLLQSPKQKTSNSQVISSQNNKDVLSLSKNSQEGQKIFQDTIGQISDIKPTSKKMIDDDNKTSFNEDHFEMLFGKKNEESIDQQVDNSDDESPRQNHKNYIHIENRKQKQNMMQQGDSDNDYGYNEDRESEFNNYDPQSDEEGYDQEQSQQYKEDDDEDDENHDNDSLEQEAPYLNQNK
ncbi:hypothetical protein TTHERM_00459440 (macronuclear) [Tetrahymena thermophila SB210]|uniref:Uncharacterized protein n=1 Tax=Tetrahymena thermophila (strain SB210) TaxID=312017 RepID=I7MM57_TETTS|nr:hypothetical protein TTHERM_00459440 [Tetrahymena thermophila SB210]EAS04007.1 hypothetical protein TTHERM_00459440 [Tetrahymena thermophila SB210]|eukprot:XP_001024252.1 hypothetical protein TTHERM_00459440 [Tetrahymena thermophila SB210]